RTWSAVASADRTIMSSSFSSPSPPAAGMVNSCLFSRLSLSDRFLDQTRATCANLRLQTCTPLKQTICNICASELSGRFCADSLSIGNTTTGNPILGWDGPDADWESRTLELAPGVSS